MVRRNQNQNESKSVKLFVPVSGRGGYQVVVPQPSSNPESIVQLDLLLKMIEQEIVNGQSKVLYAKDLESDPTPTSLRNIAKELKIGRIAFMPLTRRADIEESKRHPKYKKYGSLPSDAFIKMAQSQGKLLEQLVIRKMDEKVGHGLFEKNDASPFRFVFYPALFRFGTQDELAQIQKNGQGRRVIGFTNDKDEIIGWFDPDEVGGFGCIAQDCPEKKELDGYEWDDGWKEKVKTASHELRIRYVDGLPNIPVAYLFRKEEVGPHSAQGDERQISWYYNDAGGYFDQLNIVRQFFDKDTGEIIPRQHYRAKIITLRFSNSKYYKGSYSLSFAREVFEGLVRELKSGGNYYWDCDNHIEAITYKDIQSQLEEFPGTPKIFINNARFLSFADCWLEKQGNGALPGMHQIVLAIKDETDKAKLLKFQALAKTRVEQNQKLTQASPKPIPIKNYLFGGIVAGLFIACATYYLVSSPSLLKLIMLKKSFIRSLNPTMIASASGVCTSMMISLIGILNQPDERQQRADQLIYDTIHERIKSLKFSVEEKTIENSSLSLTF